MSIASRRMSRIKASPAAVISAKAMEMARAGRDVIALSAGEPDFDTPDPIKIAAIRAIVEGKTKYPPLTGIPELREAICRKLERENGLRYTPDQVLVSNGGKQVIYNALAATLDPEDEVLVPAPFWVSYPDMALLAGGTPVVVAADAANGFRLTAEQLEGAITARTKWLILNNPGNPSGAVYSARDLEGLAGVLRRHPHVWVLTDDIYEHIIYGGGPCSTIAQVAPDLHERTLTMNGLSKAYCMTGWRIGYGAGPKELIAAMAKVQSQTTAGRRASASGPGSRRSTAIRRSSGTTWRCSRSGATSASRCSTRSTGSPATRRTARSTSTWTVPGPSESERRTGPSSRTTATSRSISSPARRSRWCTARRSASRRTSAFPMRLPPIASRKPAGGSSARAHRSPLDLPPAQVSAGRPTSSRRLTPLHHGTRLPACG